MDLAQKKRDHHSSASGSDGPPRSRPKVSQGSHDSSLTSPLPLSQQNLAHLQQETERSVNWGRSYTDRHAYPAISDSEKLETNKGRLVDAHQVRASFTVPFDSKMRPKDPGDPVLTVFDTHHRQCPVIVKNNEPGLVHHDLRRLELNFIIDGFLGNHKVHQDIAKVIKSVAGLTEFEYEIGFSWRYLKKDRYGIQKQHNEFDFFSGMLVSQIGDSDYDILQDERCEWFPQGEKFSYMAFRDSRDSRRHLGDLDEEEIESERESDQASRAANDEDEFGGDEAVLGCIQ